MKKAIAAAAVLCLAAAALTGAAEPAGAESYRPAVTIRTDGQSLPGYKLTARHGGAAKEIMVDAYEQNGIVMVPLRQTADMLGYAVAWDAEANCAVIETGAAYMNIYPGVDMYERMGTLKSVNINRIYQFGAGPRSIGGILYVPVQLFEAFYNDVYAEGGGTVISPLEMYIPADRDDE